MHHYVYKVTNLITNEFYIGKHDSKFLWNTYMGSGRMITDAINKYGVKSFKKEILKSFLTGREAADYENKLILENKDNPLAYNKSLIKFKYSWNSIHI